MTGSTAPAPPAPTGGEGKGLAAGTLGLWGSTVIGLASTAPVYSLAATLGFVVLAVGAQAPIAFVIAFVPMLLIAFAYRELNRDVPDCGTTFTWATKAFGPWVGWLGGWGVAVAGTVVLANLAQIGGIYFWLLVAPDLAENVPVVTATGVVFIALMCFISWRGLEIGERMQNVLLGVQYLALALFVVFAAGAVITGTAPEGSTTPSADWFNPFAFESFDGFVESVLLALFIYWGWDTCLALNEETRDPKRIPGRAAVLTTLILLVTYVGVAVAAMSYAGLGDTGIGLGNEENADDVFFALKDVLFGPWAWLLVIAVMISAVSSTQTTILMAVVAIVFYVGMTLISDNILQDTILSLGLAIAFYYSITGLACVWYFRHTLFSSWRNFWNRLVFPLVGALLLIFAFVYSAIDMLDPEYGYTVLFGVGGVFVVGIGSLVLGAVLMVVWSFFRESRPFFRGEALNRDTEVLVPDDGLPPIRSVDGGLG